MSNISNTNIIYIGIHFVSNRSKNVVNIKTPGADSQI